MAPTAHSTSTHEIHALYHAHHGWLVEWLRRRIGCVHHANDLAHDTFLRMLDKAASTVIIEPKALLSRIAHDLMVDQVRRRDIERAYLDALHQTAGGYVDSAEDKMLVVEALVRIDALFADLHPHARTVFLYSRLEGMTYPEIAIKMDVSLRTVETYMAKAIAHILVSA